MIDFPEPEGEASSRRRAVAHRSARFSLAGRITATVFVVLVVMAGIATLASTFLPLAPWAVFLMTLAIGLTLGAWLVNRLLRPLNQMLDGLSDGIRSFHDRDFSLRLPSQRDDELAAAATAPRRTWPALLGRAPPPPRRRKLGRS